MFGKLLSRLFSQHKGAEHVRDGIYWSHRDSGFVSVPKSGGNLPGNDGDRFSRTPILFVLIAGPILGTAFAFFLPTAAIIGLVQVLLGRGSSSKVRETRGETQPVRPLFVAEDRVGEA